MIEEAEAAPSLVLLARAAGLSPSHFHRLFKLITGVTPKAYAEARRRNSVRERLTKAATVTEAVHDAGYNSASRFYANSDEVLGMKVAAYREGGTGARLRTAIGECELGTVLIAATGKGVAAILLGDNPETLLRDLQTRFPKAEFFSGDKQFENLAAKVIAYIENPSRRFELPLDVRGTAFQHRVWQALRDIPFGQTASYTDIAQKIGKPDAVRAVALACGANPAAVAIPCHRVVRNDGGLSGYRWGIDRKRTLLAREAGPAKAKKRQPAAARRTTVDKA